MAYEGKLDVYAGIEIIVKVPESRKRRLLVLVACQLVVNVLKFYGP